MSEAAKEAWSPIRSVQFWLAGHCLTFIEELLENGRPMRHVANLAVIRLLVGAALCVLAIFFMDGPVARLFSESVLYQDQKKYAVGSALLLIPLILIAVILIVWQRRRFHGARHAVILISISAVLALVTNDIFLKPIFGRMSVDEFLYWPSHYGFYFFKGGWKTNFPSGHMALVIAGVTVGWREFLRLRWLFVAVVVVVAFLLLYGEWHFVSDLIAGALWGNLVALAVVAASDRLQSDPLEGDRP
jgi:membrane-associated phospholipid phosphatase